MRDKMEDFKLYTVTEFHKAIENFADDVCFLEMTKID